MKLVKFKIENFRGYQTETEIEFGNITAFVGKNDAGKSTILEALDIFFYDGKGGVIKLGPDDVSKRSSHSEGDEDIRLTAVFDNLPTSIVLDDTNETSLESEYLLNQDNRLEIVKTFKNGATTATAAKVYINAFHPNNQNCNDLLSKKQTDLKIIVNSLSLDCDKTKNASMRTAIWNHYDLNEGLDKQMRLLEVSSKEANVKAVWEKLQDYMPFYSLFQSDRKNSDSDGEVQDPLKIAVKYILDSDDLKERLRYVAEKVEEQIQEVAQNTLNTLNSINSSLASSLHPNISTESLKWADVFKSISIDGDNDIPINKRGSGVRRLILLSFFRTEAEKRRNSNRGIIYAIEEPETSQHIEHQRLLMDSLKAMADSANTQIIITTHNGEIIKSLKASDVRMVTKNEDSASVKQIDEYCMDSPSLLEANYIALGDATEEFHDELYGYLQLKAVNEDPNNEKEKEFDNWLVAKGFSKTKQWVRIMCGQPKPPLDVTVQLYVRNSIHHPENKLNVKFTEEELKQSIEQMVTLCRNLKIQAQSAQP